MTSLVCLTPNLNAKCQNYVDSTFKIYPDSNLFSVPLVATILVQAVIISPMNESMNFLTGLLLALPLISLFATGSLSYVFCSDLRWLPILLRVKATVLTVACNANELLFYLSMDLFFSFLLLYFSYSGTLFCSLNVLFLKNSILEAHNFLRIM